MAAAILAALFVVASPHPALAIPASCNSEGGTCMSDGNCTSMKQNNPAVTNIQTTDCPVLLNGQPTGNTCCIPPPPAPPSVPAVTCASVTGYCSLDCMNDEDKGALDCPTKMNDPLQKCCKSRTSVPATPAAPATAGGASQAAAAPLALGIIPADVLPCFKTGQCTLDQIVKTGVGFANFLMGLSGALFLAIFIYGGALYLLSFGNKEWVTKGTNAIKGAAIGMVIVLAAWTIVSQIVRGIGANTGATSGAGGTGGTTGGGISATACTGQGPEWSCMTFEGNTSAQVQQNGSKAGYQCQVGKCLPASDIHVICCKAK